MALLAALAALAAGLSIAFGDNFLGLLVYLAVALALTLPTRRALAGIAAMASLSVAIAGELDVAVQAVAFGVILVAVRRYESGEYMLEKTTRDVALVPALRPSMEAFRGWFDGAADAILRGRPERGARRRRLRAAVGHALAFETWRSLVRHQGLSRSQAIEMMEALTAAAARD